LEIQLHKRETFYICGYSVETTLAENEKDVSSLYDDFFLNNKEMVLKNLHGYKKGFYGLSWYTQGHERYCYLLGVEVGPVNAVPESAVQRQVPETLFAMAHFAPGEEIIKTWSDFFYNKIPEAGLKVNEELNLYFEYYPFNVHGDYELWVPVKKIDA